MKKTEGVFGTGLNAKSANSAFCKLIIACTFFCAVSLLYATPLPLHVEDNKIKDAEGHVVVLRGVCA